MHTTLLSSDGKRRCSWCLASPQYQDYHDQEWGFPVGEDQRLFEKICLEGFQAGLSWRTILQKRDNFRQAFAQFDFNRIAHFTEDDIRRLLADSGIVRHRGKIMATINNAQCAVQMCKTEGSLAAFFWRFAPDKTVKTKGEPLPSFTQESRALSQALKKLGWKFVGDTTIYAFMQAMGMVNDHHPDCLIYPQAEHARTKWRQLHEKR